jgi:hypothetical protein
MHAFEKKMPENQVYIFLALCQPQDESYTSLHGLSTVHPYISVPNGLIPETAGPSDFKLVTGQSTTGIFTFRFFKNHWADGFYNHTSGHRSQA